MPWKHLSDVMTNILSFYALIFIFRTSHHTYLIYFTKAMDLNRPFFKFIYERVKKCLNRLGDIRYKCSLVYLGWEVAGLILSYVSLAD